jgi:hypothetical protein
MLFPVKNRPRWHIKHDYRVRIACKMIFPINSGAEGGHLVRSRGSMSDKLKEGGGQPSNPVPINDWGLGYRGQSLTRCLGRGCRGRLQGMHAGAVPRWVRHRGCAAGGHAEGEPGAMLSGGTPPLTYP